MGIGGLVVLLFCIIGAMRMSLSVLIHFFLLLPSIDLLIVIVTLLAYYVSWFCSRYTFRLLHFINQDSKIQHSVTVESGTCNSSNSSHTLYHLGSGSKIQRSVTVESGTCNPSISSQALYH